jgi:hypothetical protein
LKAKIKHTPWVFCFPGDKNSKFVMPLDFQQFKWHFEKVQGFQFAPFDLLPLLQGHFKYLLIGFAMPIYFNEAGEELYIKEPCTPEGGIKQ